MENRLDTFNDEIGNYLDHNLSQDAEKAFLSKVSQNPHLKTNFDREKNVREILRNSVQRTNVSPDLIKSIKRKIKLDY